MDRVFRIFTDGSAIGNPGPGGWGVVIIQEKNAGRCRARIPGPRSRKWS
jgi:ribonuclease HI